MPPDAKKIWEDYVARERARLSPLVERVGFVLDHDQPHTKGERYLMQAVTTKSGKKLVLMGTRKSDGKRVVMKATSDSHGKEELRHARVCRDVLSKIRFAYGIFHAPKEILFKETAGFVVAATEFIAQEKPFLERSLPEQCALALTAFKAQEGAHATTYRHKKLVQKSFGEIDAERYLETFSMFKKNIEKAQGNTRILFLLEKALSSLKENREVIEQYGGFLTHTDFVPHNIRVVGDTIYLLDHSSLRFGNKYEGWARFINFMALHNPPLAEALEKYVKDNRTPEESVALRCMRIYRLGEIIAYYTNTLSKSKGDLLALNKKRVDFWAAMLEALLKHEALPRETLEEYKSARDTLRSAQEKSRQIGLL